MNVMASFRTADLCDEHPELVRICQPVLLSYGAVESFCGPVATVRVHEDNALVRQALAEVAPDTVLVVDGGGSKRCALLGDQLAAIASNRGLAGVIIDGCVRDTADLRRMDLGILARAAHPRKCRTAGEGERDVCVEVAGALFSYGDYVYADSDGVVVASRELSNL